MYRENRWPPYSACPHTSAAGGWAVRRQMLGIPLSTIKQMKATKQYISADLQGMHNCTLGFDSLRGGDNEPS